MNDHDVRDQLERLMTDEPPHRPLPDLVRAGDRRLRRRRVSLGAGVLAVAVLGVGAAVALPQDDQTARDRAGFADLPTSSASASAPTSASPSLEPGMGQTLDPDKRSSYTYGIYSPCAGSPTCDRYEFRSKAARRPVVAAIEFRLTDGSTKRVETDHGAYDVVIEGTLPPGDSWTDDGLVDAEGQSVDLFAGLTLYAADGSVLATATATDSDELDPYLELNP